MFEKIFTALIITAITAASIIFNQLLIALGLVTLITIYFITTIIKEIFNEKYQSDLNLLREKNRSSIEEIEKKSLTSKGLIK